MARATVTLKTEAHPHYEPLYEIDPRTSHTVEIFYADGALAKSFGTRPGWYWWSCRRGFLPDRQPTGPFPTSYAAYRDMLGGPKSCFGKRRHAGGMHCS
jgi:hypothetical protein